MFETQKSGDKTSSGEIGLNIRTLASPKGGQDTREVAFQYKKRLLLRCIHHFKSDLINNMDHMRILGTQTSSAILSQTKLFQKLKSDVRKMPKQADVKWDGVINPQNYNVCQFNTENFHALKTLRINLSRP